MSLNSLILQRKVVDMQKLQNFSAVLFTLHGHQVKHCQAGFNQGCVAFNFRPLGAKSPSVQAPADILFQIENDNLSTEI